MPNIPLDAFRGCILTASATAEWVYRSQVVFTGSDCPLPLPCRSPELSRLYRPYCHRLRHRLCAEKQGHPRPVAHDLADANNPARQCPLLPRHGWLPHHDDILHFLRQGSHASPTCREIHSDTITPAFRSKFPTGYGHCACISPFQLTLLTDPGPLPVWYR